MERRNFLKSCGFACVGGTALAVIFQSCSSIKTINGQITESDISINVSEFEIVKKGKITFHNYILIENELLNHPICLYRINENKYSALYLECTHQGAELQVFGDKLQCPAHGAEFNNLGEVTSGPAETKLRNFPYLLENKQLKISLKK